jgi:hypothetical protein
MSKVIYGTTETATPASVDRRLDELKLSAGGKKAAWGAFLSGQVFAVVYRHGSRYYAGFTKGSSVGRTIQKLCRPS